MSSFAGFLVQSGRVSFGWKYTLQPNLCLAAIQVSRQPSPWVKVLAAIAPSGMIAINVTWRAPVTSIQNSRKPAHSARSGVGTSAVIASLRPWVQGGGFAAPQRPRLGRAGLPPQSRKQSPRVPGRKVCPCISSAWTVSPPRHWPPNHSPIWSRNWEIHQNREIDRTGYRMPRWV
jgi:hypothetical protein